MIMQWPSFDMKSALLPQVLKLEDSFREYEKIASPLPEEIRFAVLMKVLGGQLKTYLQVTLKDGTSYEDQGIGSSLRPVYNTLDTVDGVGQLSWDFRGHCNSYGC